MDESKALEFDNQIISDEILNNIDSKILKQSLNNIMEISGHNREGYERGNGHDKETHDRTTHESGGEHTREGHERTR